MAVIVPLKREAACALACGAATRRAIDNAAYTIETGNRVCFLLFISHFSTGQDRPLSLSGNIVSIAVDEPAR
jgi:hypothetical protein